MKAFVAAREALQSDCDEQIHLNSQRAYRLTPVQREADDYIAQVRVGAGESKNFLLPHSIGLGYFVVPTAGADVSIAAGDFRVEKLDVLTSLWVRVRLAL